MPFRHTSKALPAYNERFETVKEDHPIYSATSGDIGKLSVQESDLPMRFYGLNGDFTAQWNSALPKTRVATGLNTSMDHSKFHHAMDQGWRGNLGLTDFNIANREYSTHVVRPPRRAQSAPLRRTT